MAEIDEQASVIRYLMARLGNDADMPTPDYRALRALKTGHIYCVLLQVRDDTVEDIQRHVEQVVPIIHAHDGLIQCPMVSFHLGSFGTYGNDSPKCRENWLAARTSLSSALGDDVRGIAFHGTFAYGMLGTEDLMGYGVVLPKFGLFLNALLNTPFGQITELTL